MPKEKYAYVLTYHSQNILGTTYSTNDHVAFAQDLPLLREMGFAAVSALKLVNALRSGSFGSLPARCVVLTMDDGSVFDYEDTLQPRYGMQESMLNIMRRQHKACLGIHLSPPPFTATAFVIGSKSAREQISLSFDNDQWMTDAWWPLAQRSGYLNLGSHSWDHVHPCVAEAASRPETVGVFHGVVTESEAERQIAEPSRRLRMITKSDAARLFAYPFGQTNDFLVRDYLPRQQEVLGAFTIAPEPVTKDTNIWAIPRFVCGDNWKSPEDLRALLGSKG